MARPALGPILLALAAGQVAAQTQFRELVRAVLPPAASATQCVAAVDLDGDVDPDLVLGRSDGGVRLFTNLCGGSFRDDSGRLPPPGLAAVYGIAAADLDRDGDLDLLLATAGQERLLINTAGALRDETGTRLPVLADDSRAVVAFDADRDGDLDLFVANAGQDRLLLNDGNGVFIDGTTGRLPVDSDAARAAVAVDFDQDGDLDLFAGTAGREVLRRNDGSGRFTDASALLLAPPAAITSVAAADIDRDGRVDLLSAGSAGMRLYLARGTGFSLVPTSTPPSRLLAVGDVDRDGWTDVFEHGEERTTLRINVRDGARSWIYPETYDLVPRMPDPLSGSILVDVDLDADADLVLVGPGAARVYFNDGSGNYLRQPDRALAEWMRDTDVIAAGDVDRDGDPDLVFLQPHRQVFSTQGLLLHNDGHGNYTPGAWISSSVNAALFADVNGDGWPDLIGADDYEDKLYLNYNGVLRHSPTLPYALFDVTRALAAGDVDGDGDVDLVFGNHGPSKLYLNAGTAYFHDGTAGRLPAVSDAATGMALLDLDGDADLDLVIANQGRPNRVLQNDGSGRFTDLPASRFSAIAELTRAVAAGDVDGDGDPDLLFGNWGQSRLYRNDPAGFVDVTATALPVLLESTNAVALGDVDLDLDLDLVLGNLGRLRLLVNDGRGAFTEDTASRLPGIDEAVRAVLLLDTDRDADLDLVTAAYPGRPRLLGNLARQVHAPSFAHIGCGYDLDFHVTPWRPAPRTIIPFLSPGRRATPVATPFGWFGLDTTSLVALPVLTTGIGFVRYSLPIPANPVLRSGSLHTQALFQIATWRTSNVVSDRVN